MKSVKFTSKVNGTVKTCVHVTKETATSLGDDIVSQYSKDTHTFNMFENGNTKTLSIFNLKTMKVDAEVRIEFGM